jgi:hypothetical protein
MACNPGGDIHSDAPARDRIGFLQGVLIPAEVAGLSPDAATYERDLARAASLTCELAELTGEGQAAFHQRFIRLDEAAQRAKRQRWQILNEEQ